MHHMAHGPLPKFTNAFLAAISGSWAYTWKLPRLCIRSLLRECTT